MSTICEALASGAGVPPVHQAGVGARGGRVGGALRGVPV